jgi:hypothetical protein
VSRRIERKHSLSGKNACDSGLTLQDEMCPPREIVDEIGVKISVRFWQLRGLKSRFGLFEAPNL